MSARERFSDLLSVLKDQRRLMTRLQQLTRGLRAMVAPSPASLVHFRKGGELLAVGNAQGALACYLAALDSTPGFVQAHATLGVCLGQLGHLAAQLHCLRVALRLNPVFWEAQMALGYAYAAMNQTADAVSAYETATRLRPDHVDSWSRLGRARMARGDAAGAAAALAEAVMRSPDAADLWLELGNALRAAGDTEQALQAYLAALERRPGLAMAHDNAGCVLQDLGRLDDAIRHHRMALEFAPDDPNALRNLGVALQTIGQFDEAIRIYRRALAGPSADAALAGYLGAALTECGRLQEARDAFATALVFAPNDADIRFNHSLLLLKSGDLRRGWREHEWRWRVMPPHRIAQPQWHGEPARGQRILLHAEQGLGDTLQFVRYAPRVAARGLHVILQVQAPLVRLLRGLPGVAEVIADDAPRPEAELHCPLMSLPLAFNTGLDTIPGEPYLAPPPDLLDKWAQHLPPNDRLRVGLAWAGNPRPGEMRSHFTDRRRSVAPALLTPLADAGGVTWVNLQRDAATQPFPMMDPMGAVTDFADTAALVAQLDLVITVDTSVAHLAGAMGKPVWMLSRHDGCWRWLQDRDDSPWYPTMRIFRQTAPDGWPAVIARVSAELARAAAAR